MTEDQSVRSSSSAAAVAAAARPDVTAASITGALLFLLLSTGSPRNPPSVRAHKVPVDVMVALVEGAPVRAIAHRDPQTRRSLLHAAAASYAGSPEVVKRLLARRPAAAVEECVHGETPLTQCMLGATDFNSSSSSYLAVIKALLAAAPKCAAKARKSDAALPLHLAVVRAAPLAVIKELIRVHPAAAKRADSSGCLALHHALHSHADTGVMRALLHAHPGAAITKDGEDAYPLHFAVEDGCPVEIVRALLAADKTCARLISINGEMALHAALYHGQTHDVITLLLRSHAAAAKHASNAQWLPLHFALARDAAPETVRMVLAAHRPAAAHVGGDLTPLHLAAERGNPDVVREIAAACPAAAHHYSSEVGLPLHFAAGSANACVEVVRSVLAVFPGAARRPDADGALPLHIAATSNRDISVVKLLLESYPSGLHYVDQLGRTPVHCVVGGEVTRLLIEGLTPAEVRAANAAVTAAAAAAAMLVPVPGSQYGNVRSAMVAAAAEAGAAAAAEGGGDGDSRGGAEMLSLLARVRQGAASDLAEGELAALRGALTGYVHDLDAEIAQRPVEERLLSAHPEWMCPIGHGVLRDPVLAADGHVYERRKLTLWMRRSRGDRESDARAGVSGASGATWKSPMTGLALTDFALTTRDDLRAEIEAAVRDELEHKTDVEAAATAAAVAGTGAVAAAGAAVGAGAVETTKRGGGSAAGGSGAGPAKKPRIAR